MQFPKEVIEGLISNTRVDSKGQNLYGICPFCGEDEFGISLNQFHPFRCFRGSNCGEVGNIFKLLTYLDRRELLDDEDYYRETDISKRLNSYNLDKKPKESEKDLPNVKSPVGWRRVRTHDYLEKRGFTESQFTKYEVGVTNLLRKYKGYVIFLVRQEGFIKGFVSRNTKSKEEIDLLNDQIKEYNKDKSKDKKKSKIVRYSNSLDTDFSKILFGIDEVVQGVTQTIIIVEGLMDKINLEIIAPELFENKEIVVVCTWGKKISEFQIKLAKDKYIDSVILMYDPDAIEDMKEIGYELQHQFSKVRIGSHNIKDPGDWDFEEFLTILDNLKTPSEFKLDKLQKRVLK